MSKLQEVDFDSETLNHMDVDVKFVLTSSEFRWWSKESSEEGCVKIPMVNIICVTSLHGGEHGGGILQICVAQRQTTVELRRVMEEFYGSTDVCNACAELLKKHISKDAGRPKRALVIISPLSGSCKGKQIYEEKVAPLFKEAGIQTDIKEIERSRHATEIIAKYDITTIDSIVVLSGDGIFSEVADSLLRNHYTSCTGDVNQIGIPIGLIPTGTGNVMASRCYGTRDVETAVLTIISGRRRRTGVLGVYSAGRLVAYAALTVGYGFTTDIAHVVWSKGDRTSYFNRLQAIFRVLTCLLFQEIREMDMTVKLGQPISPGTENTPTDAANEIPPSASASAPAPDKRMKVQSFSNSTDNVANLGVNVIEDASISREKNENATDRMQWTTKSGLYITLGSWFSFDTFASDKSEGLQPGGVTRLRLFKPSSRWQLVKSLYHSLTFNKVAMKNDYNVEDAGLASEYIIKLNNPSDPSTERGQHELRIAIDGDLVQLPGPEFHVKVYDQKIQLFCNI